MSNLVQKLKTTHSWNSVIPSNKLQHARCRFCPTEKWFDNQAERIVYQNPKGERVYRAGKCNPHN